MRERVTAPKEFVSITKWSVGPVDYREIELVTSFLQRSLLTKRINMIRKILISVCVVVLALNTISNVLLWRDGLIQVGVNNTLGKFAARADINSLLIARDLGLVEETDVRDALKDMGVDPDAVRIETHIQLAKRLGGR